MKNLEQLKLKGYERDALLLLKEKVCRRYPNAEIILFGSKARGESDNESDIDIIILVDTDPLDFVCGDVDKGIESFIRDIVYEIELLFGVVFNVIIESKKYWNSSLVQAMPLYWNVHKDGISI